MENIIDDTIPEEKVNDIDLDLASRKDRITNFLMDMAIFYLVYYSFISIAFENYGIEIEYAPLLNLLLLFGSHFFVYVALEYLFQKTPAKFLTQTKVVKIDGTKPSFKQILGRATCRLIPCEAYSFFLLENGIHDKFTNTRVVNAVN